MLPPKEIVVNREGYEYSGKTHYAYYCVYSPKKYCKELVDEFIQKVCLPGGSYFVTHELGEKSGNHLHANFIYYSHDKKNEPRRCYGINKCFKKPMFYWRKVRHMDNVLNYNHKEQVS